ncbi:MAG: FAD-dependent oxidoreductase [Gammaproteobacteria bacterium]
MHPIVILGTGLAGYHLAQEIRKLDKNVPLQLLTASDGRYYSKPVLSNALSQAPEKVGLQPVSARDMSQRLQAEIWTNTVVTDIDPAQHEVYTANQNFPYSKLILACGARPRTLPFEASVYTVNHLHEYEQLQQALLGKQKIGILGAGLIGCEFANHLSRAGYAVDVIAPVAYPLAPLLPPQIGRVLQHSLAQQGVQWHLPNTLEKIESLPSGHQLQLLDKTLTVDLLISAIGLQPNIELAQAAGLLTNRGIVVDQYLQTSAADIYALGDCMELQGQVLQFVAPLLQGSRSLAKTLIAEPTALQYSTMPIVLKTPDCPLVFIPPSVEGEWQVTGEGKHLKALFYNQHKQLRGYALTGEAVRERSQLVLADV